MSKITKVSAVQVAKELTPAAQKLLIDMFVNKLRMHTINRGSFVALLELLAKGILRADMSWDNEPVTVLERGGRFVVDVLRARKKDEVKP